MDISHRKKAVIYCRVSTKEQVEEGNSLSTQEKHCREYAKKHGYEVAAVFIEQGESAKTADRTELKKLMTFCAVRKNNIHAIIAYKIDRISRNIDDYSQIRIYLKRYGVEIKSTSEHFEDTPAGRFMENIIANVAQFDNDVRAERSIGGMRDAMREGRYVWRAPYGYSNTRSNGKTTIVSNDLAPLIHTIFEEIAMNIYPTDAIRLKVCQDPHLKKPIAKGYFYRLIRNELYAGWICKFGERHKGAFEPIISDELFAKVQQVLSKKAKVGQPYCVLNPDFPLRRFFKHSSGRLLTGCWSTGKNKKYAYYKFHTTAIWIRKEKLEETFKNWLNDFNMDIASFEKLYIALKLYLETTLRDKQCDHGRIRARINDLKVKQDVIIDKNISGIITDEMCKEKLANINAELYDLNKTINNFPDFSLTKEEILRVVRAALLYPGKIWEKASFENKIRLQWFYFPKGIILTETESRTPKICKLFKLTQTFSPFQSLTVNHRKRKSNTTNWQILRPPENDHLDTTPKSIAEVFSDEAVVEELAELASILKSEEKPSILSRAA